MEVTSTRILSLIDDKFKQLKAIVMTNRQKYSEKGVIGRLMAFSLT